jgi:hypothetical protein
MNKWIKAGLVLGFGVAASAGVLLAAAWQVVKPAPDEWTEQVRWGRWTKEVSMPAVLRLATHPMTLRLLEGHTLRTRFGPVQWSAGDKAGTWKAVCTPCTFHVGALGGEAIRLSRAEFTVEPDDEMKLHGTFFLGDDKGAQARLEGHWQSRIERQQARLNFTLIDQPIERAFGLFSADVPELKRAQIDGRINLKAQLVLPQRGFTVKPRVDGFRVSGLGTEALLNAQTSCAPSDGADDFGLWLPRAVIAAEDQRFYEHPGFDLAEIMGAWTANPSAAPGADDALHGGSTLSQQLAKLIYTGDSRDHGRKLRELLYAVELDRTLGKARVLNLYLAMAPWGHGLCGAHAAARHFLGKPAAALTPMEAVWLATLLHNPDRELAQMARNGQVNAERVAWVASQIRPLPRQRDAWLKTVTRWAPPHEAFTSAMAVSASRAALGH